MADEIKVESRHVNIQIDISKIHESLKQAICPDAEKSAQGDVHDAILLSHHQCGDDPQEIKARSLLVTLQQAEMEGSLKSNFNFSLQKEYDVYRQKKDIENAVKDKMNEQQTGTFFKGGKPQ